MRNARSLFWPALWVGVALALAVACGAPRAPAEPRAQPPPAASAANPTPVGSAAPATAALPTSPVVSLNVQVSPTASYGPLFVAQEKGYFREMGLEVTLHPFLNVIDSLPALVQGQLHVGVGSSSAGVLNALNRQADILIVADLTSAGKTEKSTGSIALVARRDLWEAGVLRGPRDLVDRTVYTVAPGSATQAQVVRWLRAHGVDESRVEFSTLPYPEMMLGMKNRAIEVAGLSEPFLTLGAGDGTHVVLATQEEMHPGLQLQFLMYWKHLDTLGPEVGTRFMVAYLKGARARLEAMEYGVDQDAVIQILTNNTPVKEADLYRQSKYPWVDPNGVLNRQAIESDAELWRQLGVIRAATFDISGQFEDRYRQRAVEILGEYRLR